MLSVPPAMPASMMSGRDLAADQDRGRQARAAGALHVKRGRLGGEPGRQRRFTREVPIARVFDYRAERDVAEPLV